MSHHVSESTDDIAAYVRTVTEEVIAGTSYFLVDIEVRGHKGTRVVEIFVDSDTDLNHDDLATISGEVGFLLDMEDRIDGSYRLEVSSPGIKRPLQHPRQFKKNVGRDIRVKYKLDGETDTENVTGTLATADDEAIEVEVAPDRRPRIPYDAIERAKLKLPW